MTRAGRPGTGANEIFGENAFLGLTRTGQRSRTAVANTMVQLCYLDRHDMEFLQLRCPSFRQALQQVVCERKSDFVHTQTTCMLYNLCEECIRTVCVMWQEARGSRDGVCVMLHAP